MCRCLPLILIALIPSFAVAAGWHDYRLEISERYSIYRMNSFQVCLGKTNGILLICPDLEPDAPFGPIAEYAVSDGFVATRNYGAKPHPKNPLLPAADVEKEFYFLLSVGDDEIAGPLDPAEWRDLGYSDRFDLVWETPENPDLLWPILGTLLFIGLSIPILAVKFWYVTFALVGLAVALVWRRRSRSPDLAA